MRSDDRDFYRIVGYCIVGGPGSWRGIPETIIERIDKEAQHAFLAVTAWKKGRHEEESRRY
jgi:hypothetical protein